MSKQAIGSPLLSQKLQHLHACFTTRQHAHGFGALTITWPQKEGCDTRSQLKEKVHNQVLLQHKLVTSRSAKPAYLNAVLATCISTRVFKASTYADKTLP
jgi:hypothetical protein